MSKATNGATEPAIPFAIARKHASVTERLSAAMEAQDGADPVITPEDLVKMFLAQGAAQMKGSGDGDGPPKKQVMGHTASGWLGWAFKAVAAGVLFLVLWYNTVNKQLANTPSYEEVEAAVDAAIVDANFAHSGAHQDLVDAHVAIDAQLDANINAIGDIRESQIRSEIRSEGTDKTTTQALKDIKEDLRYIRRRD